MPGVSTHQAIDLHAVLDFVWGVRALLGGSSLRGIVRSIQMTKNGTECKPLERDRWIEPLEIAWMPS
jgi:hypothetical protein